MIDIPEDIIKSANAFQDMVDNDPKAYTAFDVAVLAMVAERNRCAKTAEHWKETLVLMEIDPNSQHQLAVQAVNDISQAILNQTEE